MNLRVRRVTGVSTSAILSDCRDDEISRKVVDRGGGRGEGTIDRRRNSTGSGLRSTRPEAKSIARFLVVLGFAGAAWSVRTSR